MSDMQTDGAQVDSPEPQVTGQEPSVQTVPDQGTTPNEPTTAPSPDESRDYGENAQDSFAAGQKTDLPDKERQERQAQGKLQQVQRELAQKNQALQQIVQNAQRTPESYKNALMSMSNFTAEQAEKRIEEIKAQGKAPAHWYNDADRGSQGYNQMQQNVQAGRDQTPPDPYAIARQAVMQYDQERTLREQQEAAQRELQELSSQFFSQVPELDPKNVPMEKQAETARLVDIVQLDAERRVQLDPSLKMVDALVTSYKQITGKSDEELEQIRAEARIEGYVQSNADKSESGSIPRGQSPKVKSHGLSADQVKQAKAEGLSPEEFAELIRGSETTVG